MTTAKRQRKMSYRSSATVNFVYATKFCFDPPFFNGSSPRALSTQYSAHHTSRKSQLAHFSALPFFRPGTTEARAGLGQNLLVLIKKKRVLRKLRKHAWINLKYPWSSLNYIFLTKYITRIMIIFLIVIMVSLYFKLQNIPIIFHLNTLPMHVYIFLKYDLMTCMIAFIFGIVIRYIWSRNNFEQSFCTSPASRQS